MLDLSIFLGETHTELPKSLVVLPLWEEIIKQWSSGTSLAGCSAGAMAFGGTIMGLRRSNHSPGLSLLPDIEVIPHYDKMLGWLPERVASFVLKSDSQSVLLGIDEYTALGAYRFMAAGRTRESTCSARIP